VNLKVLYLEQTAALYGVIALGSERRFCRNGPFLPLTAVFASLRFSRMIRAAWCFRLATIVQRRLRFTIIPLIQQAYFSTCFNARDAADGYGRCASILRIGQN